MLQVITRREMTDLFVQLGEVLAALLAGLDHNRHATFQRRVFHFQFYVPCRRSLRRRGCRIQSVMEENWVRRCQMAIHQLWQLGEGNLVRAKYLDEDVSLRRIRRGQNQRTGSNFSSARTILRSVLSCKPCILM